MLRVLPPQPTGIPSMSATMPPPPQLGALPTAMPAQPLRPSQPTRKRSHSIARPDDEEDGNEESMRSNCRAANTNTNPAAAPPHLLKRTRTSAELDALRLIPRHEARPFDLGSIELAEPVSVPNNSGSRAIPPGAPILLCVLEHTDAHWQLLCAALPHLSSLLPTLRPVLLTRAALNPAIRAHLTPAPNAATIPLAHPAASSSAPSVPFLLLSLLHPLGGGQTPLDALVVLDSQGLRRLVLPFGWGAGKRAGEQSVGGRVAREGLLGALGAAVREVAREEGA
ncbi:uncharacterized protein K452DRAFT_318507 [Aplosporella prunicola CBS 121167]|uniref:Uncharacterized protein n=1 Tax=Aplosporella prunicola CBS 121167 TaxID=1176127 RepID=A0A6A6BDT0_9PEZI|nr:uncharacterized protein K452DRAFT_318507 [Aplosporella prunicola CBS 121167]KAF2142226.1 hypothetical protein K452DRAFT_318507 [Aplosporella prunicola CBS 121167]